MPASSLVLSARAGTDWRLYLACRPGVAAGTSRDGQHDRVACWIGVCTARNWLSRQDPTRLRPASTRPQAVGNRPTRTTTIPIAAQVAGGYVAWLSRNLTTRPAQAGGGNPPDALRAGSPSPSRLTPWPVAAILTTWPTLPALTASATRWRTRSRRTSSRTTSSTSRSTLGPGSSGTRRGRSIQQQTCLRRVPADPQVHGRPGGNGAEGHRGVWR